MIDVVCYYYDPVKAPLLREAVFPAIRAHGGVRAHVERHWRHGPHVRVRLENQGPAGAIARSLRDHLERQPSMMDISIKDLLVQAEIAGRAELVPPPYLPIHPDNTVRTEAADTRDLVDLLGSAQAVDCRSRCLRLGLPAVEVSLAWLAAMRDSRAARVQLTVAAMAAHAGRYSSGLSGGYHSFLSHVEDFLRHHDRDGELRARFDRHWAGSGASVTAMVTRIADGRTSTPHEAEWLMWTVEAQKATAPLYDMGLLAGDQDAYRRRAGEVGDPAVARRWNHHERTEYSEYHLALQRFTTEQQRTGRPRTVYRFTTNMLYLLLALCDVTPVERYLAAYLLSRSAERITGLSWRELLR
jgi:hypothetical protein